MRFGDVFSKGEIVLLHLYDERNPFLYCASDKLHDQSRSLATWQLKRKLKRKRTPKGFRQVSQDMNGNGQMGKLLHRLSRKCDDAKVRSSRGSRWR